MDNEYILSGSEDMNLRIWKSISYKPLGNVQVLFRCRIDTQMLTTRDKLLKININIQKKLGEFKNIPIFPNTSLMPRRKDKFRKSQNTGNYTIRRLTVDLVKNLFRICQTQARACF